MTDQRSEPTQRKRDGDPQFEPCHARHDWPEGFGASERLLGRALRDDLDNRRDEVVVATKGGLRMTKDGLVRDASRAWLRSGVEDSLRALNVDHVDIHQVHWPDPKIPVSETATALQELVDEGKIRHVGVSNFDAAEMAEFAQTRPAETVQPPNGHWPTGC